ncbi:uncharacterized protein LOC113874171 [Abrus precatorius]|uniref:Uncharacterized protein LOC113874171 n=1 Tax=Abrus precatorius TaxID=3816 RepID=A0A8B8MLS8_ABRPR|nr:uncharacterized protein LOC113874171 [Abrus precatorius]
MHGKNKDKSVLVFDPDIDRTLRRIRNDLRAKNSAKKNQNSQFTPSSPNSAEKQVNSPTSSVNSEAKMAEPHRQRTLGDYGVPNMHGYNSSIVRPTIQVNHFEIKPALLHLVQQDQFYGLISDDPNLHISNFLQLCDTIRINGVSEDAIRLRLFPFSLRDKAAKLRGEITSFMQQEGETLYEAWERYKELLRRFPHHCIPEWMQLEWMQLETFYNGMNPATRTMIDAAAGGSLNTKSLEEAQGIIDMMASSMHQSCSLRQSTRSNGYEAKLLETFLIQNQLQNQLFSEQIAALTQQISNLQAAPTQNNPLVCDFCGGNHVNGACDGNNSESQEQFNYMGYFQRQQSSFPPRPAAQQPYFQGNPTNQLQENQRFSKPLNESLNEMEETMLQFMKVTQTSFKNKESSMKKLETQIGQLAEQLSSREDGRFPSNTVINPKEQCQAVMTRSEAVVGSPKPAEKREKTKEEEKIKSELEEGNFTLLKRENSEMDTFPKTVRRTKRQILENSNKPLDEE